MLKEIVDIMLKCRNCVVLTGAGISAESGVPTFRGQDGLWRKFRPEELASMSAFMSNPQLVWEWYNWRRDLMKNVEPNPGHHAITQMEQFFEHFTLVTQNVDGLHKQAQTRRVLEIHGNIHRNKCVKCNRQCDCDINIDPDNIPCCESCGGKIRPDVVWFGETLPEDIIEQAFRETERADIMFSVGTSAIVYPAASLPPTAKRHGATLVEINIEETPISHLADFRVPAKSGEFLPELVKEFENRKSAR